MASPAPRLGLTKRNNYASLHGKAHDKHTGPDLSSNGHEVEPGDGFNHPPQESDQDSDSVLNSGVSTPGSEKLTSATASMNVLDRDSAKYFISKTKRKSAVTYGKGKRTGYDHSIQKPRPPRRRASPATGFNRPAAAGINEELLRKLDNEEQFNHELVPSRAGKDNANADLEIFNHPHKESARTHSETDESKAFLAPEDKPFVVPKLIAPLESQPFVSSQISDITNDIDEFMNRRAGKTSSQNDFHNDTDGGRPTKRRRMTPEPEFVVPPPSLSSLATGRSFHETSLDLSLAEGNQFPDIDTPACPSSPILMSSLSNSQQIVCPACLVPVEQTTVDNFKKQHKLSSISHLNTRRQELFHKFHAKIEARRLWQERKYPNINWPRLSQRLTQHKTHLQSIVNNTQESDFARRLQQTLSRPGRRSAILADERRAGETNAQDLGYYGTRGQRIVGDWLLREFSTQLRQQAPDDAMIKLAGGVGGYIAKVLVPEAIQEFIKQDLWDTKGMMNILQERIRDVASTEQDADGIKPADQDLRALLELLAQEFETSLSEMQCFATDSNTSWLARFVAVDSAQCGLLLSEEMEDVVRLQDDTQDAI